MPAKGGTLWGQPCGEVMLMEQRFKNIPAISRVQAHVSRFSREMRPFVMQQSHGESPNPEQLLSLYRVMQDMHASLARDLALLSLHLPASEQQLERLGNSSSGRNLSCKECEVLNMFARGYTYAEVAVLLGCKLATIQTYAKRIYRKLNVHSRAEAIFEASHLGLIQL